MSHETPSRHDGLWPLNRDLARSMDPAEGYPLSRDRLPQGNRPSGRYDVHFAWSPEDLDRVAKLRFEVFNLELKEGLDQSYETERDIDPYDPFCHHLMVSTLSGCCQGGELVGTYRLQTAQMAAENRGFYTQDIFDLRDVPSSIVESSVELSRACVARGHRSQKVLFLLWRGLAGYMMFNRKRYLFGCCSLTSQDVDEGLRAYQYLQHSKKLHPQVKIHPVPSRECFDVAKVETSRAKFDLPQLFRIYLRYGALVCGPPAIDREFKTIDFPVLFDIDAMDPLSRRLFFSASLW